MFQGNTFADAAFADNGGDLALLNGAIDLIKNHPIAEAFGYIFKFDQICVHSSPPSKKEVMV